MRNRSRKQQQVPLSTAPLTDEECRAIHAEWKAKATTVEGRNRLHGGALLALLVLGDVNGLSLQQVVREAASVSEYEDAGKMRPVKAAAQAARAAAKAAAPVETAVAAGEACPF